jgi:hypothetical protein
MAAPSRFVPAESLQHHPNPSLICINGFDLNAEYTIAVRYNWLGYAIKCRRHQSARSTH